MHLISQCNLLLIPEHNDMAMDGMAMDPLCSTLRSCHDSSSSRTRISGWVGWWHVLERKNGLISFQNFLQLNSKTSSSPPACKKLHSCDPFLLRVAWCLVCDQKGFSLWSTVLSLSRLKLFCCAFWKILLFRYRIVTPFLQPFLSLPPCMKTGYIAIWSQTDASLWSWNVFFFLLHPDLFFQLASRAWMKEGGNGSKKSSSSNRILSSFCLLFLLYSGIRDRFCWCGAVEKGFSPLCLPTV